MTLNEYQEATEKTAVYPRHILQGVPYAILSLCGEAGEAANKLKKVIRGDMPLEDQAVEIIYELGDCLWYVAQAADKLGFDLESVARFNLEKLQKRAQDKKIQGQGDHR